jgi:hypothetical protein
MLGDEDGAWILVQSQPSGAVSVSRLPSLIARFFSLQEFLHGPYRVGKSKPLRGAPQTAKVNAQQTVEFRDRLPQEAESRHGQGIPLDGEKTLCKKVGNVSATESSRAG